MCKEVWEKVSAQYVFLLSLQHRNNRNSKSFYEDIALDNQSDEYKYYSSLIAQCEHFATCIVEEVYDFDILSKISKKHLVYVYEKTYPIIEQAQYSDRLAFSNFEDLVCGLKWKRDCKKQSNENPGFTKK